MKPSDQFKHRLSGLIVQIAGGFVREQQLRPGHQRTGDRNSLLLSARKLAGSMLGAIRQAHFAQPLQRFGFRLVPVASPYQQGHGHIFRCGEFRQQIMKLPDESNLAVAKIRCRFLGERSQVFFRAVYVTFRSAIKRTQDVQQGTLAGTRLPHDRHHLALLYSKR